ncbi:hypothetical protein N431DRAFT_354271 [Stipitochalara longipes BDJ]|nr:hypothetical protein N431DRAFT_354271 [Stipitochalara longipes BDJ]
MSGRGLGKAFRCCDCAVKSSSKGLSIQRRNFTSSSSWRRHGAVPAFTETSSPELNDLLSELRLKVFLPSHLSKQHKNLIYKKKYENELSTEPVIATIAEEDFQLQHIDFRKDLPNLKKSLLKAIALMKDKRDWANLPNLLEGLKTSGANMRTSDIKVTLLNKIMAAGRQEALLECLRRVEDTGIQLRDPDFVTRVMLAMQRRAFDTDWHEHETAKALKWAEMVVELMESPWHAGSRILVGDNDPRLQPEVIGILLELAAVRAVKHLESRDEDGKVAEYGAKLLGTPLEFRTPAEEVEYELNPWLWAHVPVLHGINEALKVLEPSSAVAEGLQKKGEVLDAMLSTYYEKLAYLPSKVGRKLMGLQIYEKLLG